jgi:hypothetical protein
VRRIPSFLKSHVPENATVSLIKEDMVGVPGEKMEDHSAHPDAPVALALALVWS